MLTTMLAVFAGGLLLERLAPGLPRTSSRTPSSAAC